MEESSNIVLQLRVRIQRTKDECNHLEKQIQEIADEKIKIPMIRENRKFKCISGNRNYFI